MSTLTRSIYAADQWHEIAPAETITQITHNGGSGIVYYTEDVASASLGSVDDGSVPIEIISRKGDYVYFSDVGLGNSIYLYPVYASADLTISKV